MPDLALSRICEAMVVADQAEPDTQQPRTRADFSCLGQAMLSLPLLSLPKGSSDVLRRLT